MQNDDEKLFWSKSTGGFYPSSVDYPSLPDDLVEVSFEQRDALLTAQAQGKAIAADANGAPIAIEPPPVVLTLEQQIMVLEASVTPRRTREALLTVAGKAWLESVDASIADLRKRLK